MGKRQTAVRSGGSEAHAMGAIATYHPAYIKREPTRAGPTFLRDITKAVRMVQGAPPDPPLTVVANPTVGSSEWRDLAASPVLSVDIETAGLSDQLLAIGLACDEGWAVSVDWQSAPQGVRQLVIQLLVATTTKVFQNGAYDIPILARNGLTTNGELFDTMLAGYILAPDDYINLSHLASIYLDVPPWKHHAAADLLLYNGRDAGYTRRLYRVLRDRLIKTGQLRFFTHHVMPLLRAVILPLNANGMRLDRDRQRQLTDDFKSRLGSWKTRVKQHFVGLSSSFKRELVPPVRLDRTGTPIGDSLSSKRTQELLYGVFGLPIQHHPKTGQPTTDRSALAKLEHKDTTGTISLLLERSRLKETENHLHPPVDPDGMVRSRYVFGGDEKHRELTAKGSSRSKDKGPGTGRLASREPNLQNVPHEVRVMYCASRPNWWLVEGDLSQIEARVTAWLSGDPVLQEALDEGDVYLYTMYLIDRRTGIYGVSNSGWRAVQARYAAGDPAVRHGRTESKRSFLGWSYRMGARKLELTTGIPYARAKGVLNELNAIFVGVTRYWDKAVSEATTQGWLATPFGRRREFHQPSAEVPAICNFRAQSIAADVLYTGQLKLASQLDGLGRPVGTVHDSNLVEGPKWQPLAKVVKQSMETSIDCLGGLSIPCTIKVGRNWGELKEMR